jgi:hypothetical protein
MVFSACVLGGYFLLKNGRFSCPNSSSCVSSEKTFCGEFKSARFSSSDGSIKVNGLVAKKKTVDGVKYITIQGRILNKSGLEQLLPKIEVNILRKSKRSNIYQDVEPSVPKSVESKSSNNLRNALLLEKVGSVYESNIELSGAIVTLLGNNSAPEIPPAAVASTSESEDASLNITTKVDGSGTETDLETNLSPLQTEEKTSQPAKVEIKGGGRMIKRIVYRFARKSLLPNEKMLFETEPIAIRDGCEDLLYDVSFIEPASANNEK